MIDECLQNHINACFRFSPYNDTYAGSGYESFYITYVYNITIKYYLAINRKPFSGPEVMVKFFTPYYLLDRAMNQFTSMLCI